MLSNIHFGFAGGLAKAGLVPVVPIYSSFYQRAFDQAIHDIALQNLSVVMCVDRAGIVGNDGETHQGIFDLSFFSIIPNVTIMAPKDFKELENMLEYAIGLERPVVIRYPRGTEGNVRFAIYDELERQTCEVIKEGKDLSIIAIGKMVDRAIQIANKLDIEGLDVEVINVRFLKPIDREGILKSIMKTRNVITIEDNVLSGGLGSHVQEIITTGRIDDVRFKMYGYPDEFVKHGSVHEIEKKYGLDVDSIVDDLMKDMACSSLI